MPNKASFDKETKQSNLRFLSMAIPLIMAIWGVLFIFNNALDPSDFTELPQNIREDHVTSLFYRADSWHFPLSLTTSIGEGIPLSLTDSIPLMAMIYKIFNIPTLQYFGMWLLISFGLYSFFAYRISKNIFPNNPLAAGLGSLIFLLLPFIWYHPSYVPWFGGQWLILWTYSIYFKEKQHASLEWYGILALSCLVHPFFAIVCFAIITADLFHLYIYNHSISSYNAASTFSYILTISILALSLVGVFYTSYLSTNLVPIPPLSFSNITGATYNISYLSIGLGCLIGFVISAIIMISSSLTRYYLYYYRALAFTMTLFICYSLIGGLQVTETYHLIFPFLEEGWIKDRVAPLLTSGPRFFIPILLLIPSFIIYTAYSLEKSKKHMGILFLILIFTIEFFLFSPPSAQLEDEFYHLSTKDIAFLDNAQSLEWVYLEEVPLRPQFYDVLAYYAFNNNLSINVAPLIRFPSKYLANLEKEKEEFLNKEFKKNTIYILDPQNTPKELMSQGKTYSLGTVLLFKL